MRSLGELVRTLFQTHADSPRPEFVRQALADSVLPPRSECGRAQISAIYLDMDNRPTERLLDLTMAAAEFARQEDLGDISSRMQEGPRWPDIWPGEHYKFLAGLVRVMKPRVVIEIGTYQGLGALALARRLPPGGAVHTFDIVPWQTIQGQTMRTEDIDSGRIVPHQDDLVSAAGFERNRALLESSTLLFVDAAKDGVMERVLLDRFESLRFREPAIVVFDDTRLWNMLDIWRDVKRPKLDATSFGHWSGTGLIDWAAENPGRSD